MCLSVFKGGYLWRGLGLHLYVRFQRWVPLTGPWSAFVYVCLSVFKGCYFGGALVCICLGVSIRFQSWVALARPWSAFVYVCLSVFKGEYLWRSLVSICMFVFKCGYLWRGPGLHWYMCVYSFSKVRTFGGASVCFCICVSCSSLKMILKSSLCSIYIFHYRTMSKSLLFI